MRNTVRLMALAAAVAAGAACGGGGSNPSGPTAAAPPPDYSGTWQGNTSQSQPITITVQNGQVTALSLGVRVSMGFSSGTCAYTLLAKSPAPISGGAFEAQVESAAGISYRTTVRGRFGSGASANGTVDDFSVNGMICGSRMTIGTPVSQGSATWTASKQ